MNSVPLGRLAAIRSGMTFESRREADRDGADGRYRLVRIGDLTDEGEIHEGAEFPSLSLKGHADPKQLPRAGDILFPARGLRTTAAVYRGTPANAVVGSQFFVIRIQEADLLPEFLVWYFTTGAAQRYFDEHRGGTHVQFVSRATLAKFPVPVPPLDRQHNVVRLFELTRREQRIVAELYQKRQRLVEAGLSLAPEP